MASERRCEDSVELNIADGSVDAESLRISDLWACWWQPAATDVWREVRATLADDRLVIAAVDNFHPPFRPAYGDVHTAHLVVVYGLGETRGVVHVSDAMPPALRGTVPIEEFLRSWSSATSSAPTSTPSPRPRQRTGLTGYDEFAAELVDRCRAETPARDWYRAPMGVNTVSTL